MHIDRSNYAIWIIDWLDGNLSALQVSQLKLFLKENPDLREESEELTLLNLKTSADIFPRKNRLKKSMEDLPPSQFEYLCVAYLEGDLSSVQKTELLEIINSNPLNKRHFELIQQTIILKPNIQYTRKYKLYKRTSAQKVFRISAYGLSAAAAIILMIISFFTIPRNLPVNNSNRAENLNIENINLKPSKAAEPVLRSHDNKSVPAFKNKNINTGEDHKDHGLLTSETHEILSEVLIVVRYSDSIQLKPVRVPAFTEFQINDKTPGNKLIASKPSVPLSLYENDRSKFSRFIARTFREKILKEKSSSDTPLRGYEFAEAGVSGINKLLGWEMALEKNNDINGELKSLYFSSKILKFQTPIKKAETLP